MKELISKLKDLVNSSDISDNGRNEMLSIIGLQEKQNIKTDFKLQSLVQKVITTENVLNNIIDEIKQKNIKIQKYADALKQANKTKDRFFSIIAHDLKSPFNSLIGFSELTKIALEENDISDIKKMNELIYQTSTNTYKLLLNLLDWARTQTNDIQFNPVKININEIITENVKLFKAQADKKGITIQFNPEKTFYTYADIDMTNIIIRNLLSNAIKFTKQGSVKISLLEQEDISIITIKDTGVGIKKEIINQLFSIGDNFSTNGTAGEPGTGLGLVLCKEFVNKNKGELYVESEIDKGSVFTLELPLYKSHEAIV